MKKVLESIVSLSIAAVGTILCAMGVEWYRGDTATEFKAIGVGMFVIGIVVLIHNVISVYTKRDNSGISCL